MILFLRSKVDTLYAVGVVQPLGTTDVQKLSWLFGGAELCDEKQLQGN